EQDGQPPGDARGQVREGRGAARCGEGVSPPSEGSARRPSGGAPCRRRFRRCRGKHGRALRPPGDQRADLHARARSLRQEPPLLL
ncbi:MAG: hypothetical protein AVDCRST_MAG47-906, partial [uncultured Nocardioidaceae bacterium]